MQPGSERELARNRSLTEPRRQRSGLSPLSTFTSEEITIVSKRAIVQGRTRGLEEYAPAERRSIDRAIAQSEKEYRERKNAGPFDTAEEFSASMEAEIRKLRMARRKRSRL